MALMESLSNSRGVEHLQRGPAHSVVRGWVAVIQAGDTKKESHSVVAVQGTIASHGRPQRDLAAGRREPATPVRQLGELSPCVNLRIEPAELAARLADQRVAA
jgi:hypothetical protein